MDKPVEATDSDRTPEDEVKGERDEDPRLVQANKLFQMGVMLIYGKKKSIDKAIKCIQKAITFIDKDYRYWQFLGEAYYQRGSLNPAINCFMKSLKLAEDDGNIVDERARTDSTYSRLRMSDIRLSVGHLDEAALGYRDIIAIEPTNVAALVGLAKTELQTARNNFSSGLVKSGHLHCMHALRFSLRAIKLKSHLCLTWKLASDCCLIQFVYGQRGEFIAKIEEQFPGSEKDILEINARTCIELAQQFLCKALAIEPFEKSGCLWHNLGISLYLKSAIVQKPMERVTLLKRAIKCLLKALDYDRNNSQIKNSIGVVAVQLNLMNTAQSFLIKSIQTNMSTSEIQFSNLGYMYLHKGLFGLASIAFARCQAEEPLYVRSWLGDALISEHNNVDNLSHLRHCHRLGNNYDAQIMFATKVTSLAHTDEHRRDLINALDCMKRLINYNNRALEAQSTLGLLFERCNHLDGARACFEEAYKISPQDSRVIFNKLRLHLASTDCALSKKGDSLINNDGNYEFIRSAEKLVYAGNREYLLNFIYYLFNNGDYKNVNVKMNKFMDRLPQNDINSKISAQILLGLAARADKSSDFKSWFFKNIIDLENTTCIEAVINLLCLMVLGSIVDDQLLVDQITADLSAHILAYISTRGKQIDTILYYSIEGRWIRLSLFCSIFCLKDKGKLIRPFLALFPTVAELWLYLGLTLMFQKATHKTAISCLTKANMIGSTTCADLGVVCDILLSLLSQVVVKSKSNSKAITIQSRARYLSRALYKCPSYGLLWSLLLKEDEGNKQELMKKNHKTMEEDDYSRLFQLAIDHSIRMILD